MNTYPHRLPINQWAEDDRPREKILLQGKGQLSKAELLAILIGSGNTEESAVALCKRILKGSNNSLAELSTLGIKELMSFKGIGQAKALSIVAAMELGRRRRADDTLDKKRKISCSNDAYNLLYADLSDCIHEAFWIVLLDRANQVLKKVRISQGGFSGTVADPKMIFSTALSHHASSIILAHNHPSNNLKPSQNDIELTNKIKEAGVSLEINILDHLIVGSDDYYSFADESLL